MKESYRKGVANRPDPESCAAPRKGYREALTGAHAGWVLSFEKIVRERRRSQDMRKATRTGSITRDPGRLHGVADPRHAWKLNAREPGDPGNARRREKTAGRKGNSQGHSLRVRCGEVGSLRTTEESREQTRKASGVAGGKAVNQGEHHGRTHGPDPGPGNCVPGTSGCAGSSPKGTRDCGSPRSCTT